jgi:hypothetical protein
MQIFLKPPHGRVKVLNVRPSDTVGSVKQKAAEKEGIPPDMTYLRKGSAALEDSRMLSDYDIQREATLELMISSRAANTAAAQLHESKAGAGAATILSSKWLGGSTQSSVFSALPLIMELLLDLHKLSMYALYAGSRDMNVNLKEKHDNNARRLFYPGQVVRSRIH